jgi:hypothetical protein
MQRFKLPVRRRISSQCTPSSTVTSGHDVIASGLPAIDALGPKRSEFGGRKTLSSRWDKARHASIVTPNLFRKRLTWRCLYSC